MSERQIQIKASPAELNEAAADLFLQVARCAIDDHDEFSVVLSGGSTPRSLYSLVASAKHRSAIDWTRVKFFFGDERDVAPDSDESNYRMARETLLDPLGIDSNQVRRWVTELSNIHDVAAGYESDLREYFERSKRGLDLVLLGLGDDAHTASLFPHSPALQEKQRLAVVNRVEKLNANRLTMTFPVINKAANVMFLVSGKGKADAVSRVVEGELDGEKYPAQLVRPASGKLYWLLDQPAASLLKQ